MHCVDAVHFFKERVDPVEFKYSVCPHDCPDTCAWKIELSQGRIQRIMGDPLHPVTQGVICEKAKYYVERIYGSDRVLFPMRRSGPKGSGQFERISWEEAMNEITQRWQTLIDKHGAECILPYSYAGTEGIINKASMDRRFLIGWLQLSLKERFAQRQVAPGTKWPMVRLEELTRLKR